jgi:CBS-domain-containing membrane protein
MKRYKIKDLMVPFSEYGVISEEATIYEAVLALEKAQEQFDTERYRHRAILVHDKNKKIIGKLGQLDVLRSLEPRYEEMRGDSHGITKFGFSRSFLLSMLESYKLFDRPFDDICRKAGQEKVKKYMHKPTEGEYIDESSSLDEAIHLLVLGHHQSLLVTKGDDIVGILRLTDVFASVFHSMKACSLEAS